MSASAPADSSFPNSPSGYFVYILCCFDDSLYVGHTTNVENRVQAHNEGQGAIWTACRRRVRLVYQEQYATEAHAITRERQLKRWSHSKKLALISGDRAKLKSLARRRVF